MKKFNNYNTQIDFNDRDLVLLINNHHNYYKIMMIIKKEEKSSRVIMIGAWYYNNGRIEYHIGSDGEETVENRRFKELTTYYIFGYFNIFQDNKNLINNFNKEYNIDLINLPQYEKYLIVVKSNEFNI